VSNDGIEMKRILITGNAGAGKSTLAKEVSSRLGIRLHGLDAIVWQPGWKQTPRDQRDRVIGEIAAEEEWVIDGVSQVALEAADMIVFLDVPRSISFWRVAKRNWRYLFRSRPGLPSGCPEVLAIPTLCRLIWRFPLKVREAILSRRNQGEDSQRFFHLQEQVEREEFLRAVDAAAGRTIQIAEQGVPSA
jgi:adenylate kinase family enzyme